MRRALLPLVIVAGCDYVLHVDEIPVGNGAVLVGSELVGDHDDYLSPGFAQAFLVPGRASGTTLQFFFDASATNMASSVDVGVYDDKNNVPQTLQTHAVISIAQHGWNSVSAPLFPIVSGKAYWIAVCSPNTEVNALRFPTTTNGGRSVSYGTSGLPGLPLTWSLGTTVMNSPPSVYVTDSR